MIPKEIIVDGDSYFEFTERSEMKKTYLNSL